MKGYILWISQRDGNGIIFGDDKKEYYFDRSVSIDFNNLKRGQDLLFEHNEKIKECLCAKNVKSK